MATHANQAITARCNALRKATTLQRVQPTPAQGGAPGYMVTTYTCTRWPGLQVGGTGVVNGRLLNPQGMVVAYRVMHNGITYTMPAGCLSAIGTLFVPRTIAQQYGVA